MLLAEIKNAVKKATVAIVASYPDRLPQRPFEIYGSGFCVHPEGIIVTCAHVLHAFAAPGTFEQIKKSGGAPVPVGSIVPQVMFFAGVEGSQLIMHSVSPMTAVSAEDFDLAVLKLHKHAAFPTGYPTLPVADYSEVHEMMEVATCGYPLGAVLHDQLGTVTSSFTKGMISSIIPAGGVSRQHLKGFQLD